MWQRWISPLGSRLILVVWTGFFPGTVSCTATFQVEDQQNQPIERQTWEKRPRYPRGDWIRVSGYADSRFFYGQLRLLGAGKVAGYLYRPKADPFYVYGELTRAGVIQAFDNQGVLYRLLIDPSP